MIKKQFIAGVLAASLFGFGGGVMTAQAFDFGSVLKLGGISYLVNQFGGEINTFINKIFSQNEVSTDYATKVVPILSMGTGGYIGAVQVVGPKAQVDKVKAVGQLEFKFSKIARIKGLIPIDNINITNVNRVEGVGVSAFFCDDGGWANSSLASLFSAGTRNVPPTTRWSRSSNPSLCRGGGPSSGWEGGAPTLQYEREQGAFFDGSRLSVGRPFTISGRPQNRVIEKSIRPPVPKGGLGPHP